MSSAAVINDTVEDLRTLSLDDRKQIAAELLADIHRGLACDVMRFDHGEVSIVVCGLAAANGYIRDAVRSAGPRKSLSQRAIEFFTKR